MVKLQEFNPLQTSIHLTLEKLSNNEEVEVDDAWIEEAGEQFKASLRKQFKPRDEEFRLRMSNIGKPLCQLQNEKANAPKTRMPYNHIMRMIIGDTVEAIMMVVLKAAKVNITDSKTVVGMQVNETYVPGETDIEIDGAIWDVKSSAPWAFANKWAYGWEGIYGGDTFGYVSQLYGYAKAQNKPMGGWIVIDKASGEVKVVPATPTRDQLKKIEENVNFTERALANNMPFKRGFEEEVETFFKKPTGNMLVPQTCLFCQFMNNCWPDAVLKPKAKSKAQDVKPVWYSQYSKENSDN
jgi:hypothetical protein